MRRGANISDDDGGARGGRLRAGREAWSRSGRSPIPAAKLKLGGAAFAAGEGQLALGNVGLALEAFRVASSRAARTAPTPWPESPLAMSAMGRFDLARQYYEAALAIAPERSALLTALAASLDAPGNAAPRRAEVRCRSRPASIRFRGARAPDRPVPSRQSCRPRRAAGGDGRGRYARAGDTASRSSHAGRRRSKPRRSFSRAGRSGQAGHSSLPAGPTITSIAARAAGSGAAPRPAAPSAPLQLPAAVVDVRPEPLPACRRGAAPRGRRRRQA